MNTKYWTPISLPLPHLMKPLLVPFHTLYSCEFGVMRVWEHMPMMAGMVCIFLDFMQRRPYLTSLTWLLYLTSSSFRSSARAFENTCQWWLVRSVFSFILCSGGHTSHRWRDFCNWIPICEFQILDCKSQMSWSGPPGFGTHHLFERAPAERAKNLSQEICVGKSSGGMSKKLIWWD